MTSIVGAEIHGLRGIPYVNLQQTAITDVSAMWLSHLIQEHARPDEILAHFPPIKEGSLATTLRGFDAIKECHGIIWTNNTGLTQLGLKLLREVEHKRLEDAQNLDALLASGQEGDIRDSDSDPNSNHDTSNPVRRLSWKDSTREYDTTPSNTNSLGRNSIGASTELDRDRIKIQGLAIQNRGVKVAILWQKILRLLVASRILLCGYDGNLLLNGIKPTVRIDCRSKNSYLPSFSYLLLTSQIAELHLKIDTSDETGITPSPSSSTIPISQTPIYKHDSPDMLKDLSASVDNFSFTKNFGHTNDSNPSSLTGRLPVSIWMKIILLAEDPENVTSTLQRVNMFHWARSRTSLANEIEYRSKAEDAQIRRVLGVIGGLAYEVV